jgi:hypothetical protein
LVSMPVETFRLGGGIPRPSTGIKTQALPTLRGSTENALAIFWKLKSKHRGVNDGEHIPQHILRSLFNQLHSA